jgi:hypothetical protein
LLSSRYKNLVYFLKDFEILPEGDKLNGVEDDVISEVD